MKQKAKKLFGLVSALVLCICMCIPIHSWAKGGVNRSAESDPAWTALQSELAKGGKIVLTQDYTYSYGDHSLEIPAGVQVTLDLNGYIISGGLRSVTLIDVYGELTLQDTGSQQGGIKDADTGIFVESTGVFHMKGGQIAHCGYGIDLVGGRVDFAGGEITDNYIGILYDTDENNNSYLKINGSLYIHDNEYGYEYARDIVMRAPEAVITIDGKMDKNHKIAILLISDDWSNMTGTVTKGYSTYHSESPEEFFYSSASDLKVGLTTDGEVEFKDSDPAWASLQRKIREGGKIVLTQDYMPPAGVYSLRIPVGVQVILDLNGHIISGKEGYNGGPDDWSADWGLIDVNGELTLRDTGSQKGGIKDASIGIYVGSAGVFHMESGLIADCNGGILMFGGNADFTGGEITGNTIGIIYGNSGDDNGYLKINGSLYIHDNKGNKNDLEDMPAADIAIAGLTEEQKSVITIDGKLNKNNKISILLPSNNSTSITRTATKGYSTYHTESPEEFFCSATPDFTVGLTADGEVELKKAAEFEDVLKSAYYSDAVQWAVKNNITSGTGNGKFSPDDTCTRGQIVTFLWRANGSPKMTGTTNPFKDVSAGAFYYDAVLWAVKNGITSGTSADTFSPDAGCTRGQVVTFLYRSAKDQSVASQKNPFTDVPGGAYYTTPVLWAVQRKITAGITPTTFGPEDTCSRAQIVTFLYQCMKK